jgi:hypothetical protein
MRFRFPVYPEQSRRIYDFIIFVISWSRFFLSFLDFASQVFRSQKSGIS